MNLPQLENLVRVDDDVTNDNYGHYPDKRPITPDESAEAARVFSAWESALHSSGGPWLAGSLSLADLAFVPTVVRLLAHTPVPDAFPAAAEWARRVLERSVTPSGSP